MQTKSRQLARNRHESIHNFEKFSIDDCGAYIDISMSVSQKILSYKRILQEGGSIALK